MKPYQVNTFDLCVPGFECLRNRSEIILTAHPNDDTTVSDIVDQWLSCLDDCMRPDGFDFEAARAVVKAWAQVNGRSVEHGLRQVDFPADDEDGGEAITAYLYLEVGEEHAA